MTNTMDQIVAAFGGLSATLDSHASELDALALTKAKQIEGIAAEIEAHKSEAEKTRKLRASLQAISDSMASTTTSSPAVITVPTMMTASANLSPAIGTAAVPPVATAAVS